MQDTARYVGTQARESLQVNLRGRCHRSSLLQHALGLAVALRLPVVVVEGDGKTHQTVWDTGISYYQCQLGQKSHAVRLAVRNQALAVPCTLVLLGVRVHESQAPCSLAGGKTAYYAREEYQHHRTVEHRGIHQVHFRVGAYHHYGQSTCGMRVGKAEHQQGTSLQVLGEAAHDIGSQPLGERAHQYHHHHNPYCIHVAKEHPKVNEHAHAYQEIGDE